MGPDDELGGVHQGLSMGSPGGSETQDTDLASLHGNPEFEAIVAKVKKNSQEAFNQLGHPSSFAAQEVS